MGPDVSQVDDDLGLEEEVELSLEDAMASKPAQKGNAAADSGKSRAKSGAEGTKGTKSMSSGERDDEKQTVKKSAGQDPRSAVGSAFVQLDAGQLRHLIAERPELLEAGLSVHVDDKGREIGARFDTEVGEIDLLARGGDGEWVVVLIAADVVGPELVPDVLHRLGYVRKHLADGDEAVRGIVLVEQLDDELGYAATAVSDTVAFKTWRVALTFEPLDL